MVSNRRLGASLMFVGLAFVGVAHAALAFAFDTGLATVGSVVAAGALLCLVAVNVPALLD